jgi:hypothetical protein
MNDNITHILQIGLSGGICTIVSLIIIFILRRSIKKDAIISGLASDRARLIYKMYTWINSSHITFNCNIDTGDRNGLTTMQYLNSINIHVQNTCNGPMLSCCVNSKHIELRTLIKSFSHSKFSIDHIIKLFAEKDGDMDDAIRVINGKLSTGHSMINIVVRTEMHELMKSIRNDALFEYKIPECLSRGVIYLNTDSDINELRDFIFKCDNWLQRSGEPRQYTQIWSARYVR